MTHRTGTPQGDQTIAQVGRPLSRSRSIPLIGSLFVHLLFALHGQAQNAASMSFGTANLDHCVSACSTADGGVVVVFSELDTAAMHSDVHVVRFAMDRSVLWSHRIHAGLLDEGGPILELPDGKLAFVCKLFDFTPGTTTHFVLMDANGSILSLQCVGRMNPVDLLALPDGFLLVGSEGVIVLGGGGGYSKPSVTKLDLLGTPIWSRVFDAGAAAVALSSTIASDGGFVFCGYISYGGTMSNAAFIAKVNELGDLQWCVKQDDVGNDAATGVLNAANGGYFLCGGTAVNMSLMLTDSAGNTIWKKGYMDAFGTADGMLMDAGGDLMLVAESSDRPGLWKIAPDGTPIERTMFNDASLGYPQGQKLIARPNGAYALVQSLEQADTDVGFWDFGTGASFCTTTETNLASVDLVLTDVVGVWLQASTAHQVMIPFLTSVESMSTSVLCSFVGISESPNATTYGLYPQPARERVFLPDLPPGTAYQLLTADARLLRTGRLDGNGMDVSMLSNGSYLVGVLTSSSGWRYVRVLKE